jgi:NTP pyrophosphatase (non-canonical NTP hydrolase)
MLWAKFPGVCPYCRLPRHDFNECKQVRADRQGIDWVELKKVAEANMNARPQTLADWQKMFGRIYVRDDTTSHAMNSSRLAEEFGELAEAIRTFVLAPQYAVFEAPDVFAWLMGFANQFDQERLKRSEIKGLEEYGLALEAAMEREYPERCRVCGWELCKCPPVPVATLGRIAKEAPIEQVFHGRQSLFSVSESMRMFGRVEAALKIGDREIHLNRAEIDRLAADIQSLLEGMKRNSALQGAISVNVASGLGELSVLTRQGAITQAAVASIQQQLAEMLAGLPSPKREAVVGFINNLLSSATFQAILMAAQQMAAKGISGV